MPSFRFGQQVHGNVYSRAARPGNVTTRRRSGGTALANFGVTPSPSSTNGGLGGGSSGGYNINRFNPAYDRLEEGSVIEDWIPRDIAGINKMLRIIYTRDPICGPAVDIMSHLPWSDFDIQGIEDPTIRHFYEDAAQVFGDKAQEMPAITIEFLVLGRFCGSLLYDESKGFWTDFVPHDSDFLTITPIPVRGFDPKIDLVLSPGVRQFVNSQDYRDVAAMAKLPPELIREMRSGRPLALDPLSTMYVRRKSSPTDFVGTSLYTRILPMWAIEKALMNATVTAARRRAGNILHITAGIDDRWEPSPQEMDDIAGLFIQADEDPVGAVVATRTGVEASEIRQGGDLWKWSDEWATFAEGKMRGIGVSEALLSGDATYNNMEQARSVFTEQVLTLRSYLTQQVYYRRFKTLARVHGFKKRKKAELDHRIRIEKDTETPTLQNLTQREAMDIPEEDLIVPTMQWRKSLLPEGDREYLEILEMLKEQGVPIPLKVWSARAGYDIDEALDMLDDDLKLRERIKAWQSKQGGGEEDAFASSGNDIEESPFWDRGDQFLQLKRSDASRCLKSLAETVQRPGRQEALADVDFVQRTCAKLLNHNRRKMELMNYVLMRLGIAKNLPVSPDTIEDIARYFGARGSAKQRHKEVARVRDLTGAEPRVDAPQSQKIAKEIARAYRAPALAPAAPTLLSGDLNEVA